MFPNRACVALVALVLLTGLSGPAAAQTARGTRELTLDDIFDPAKRVDFNGTVPRITWLPNGKEYLLAKPAGPRKVDAVTGRDEPFLDSERIRRALAGLPGIRPSEAESIAKGGGFDYDASYTAAIFDHAGDLYHIDLAAGRASRLTSTPGEETNTSFSPDGRQVAFVRDANLYTVDVATVRERQLTTDGGPNRLNGRLDWVYMEEIYGRGNTTSYWWSPDSASIAFLSLDETGVPRFVIPDDVPTDQAVDVTLYPQSGDPNPVATLGVVAAAGGSTTWVDLSAYPSEDRLVVRVGWTPDSSKVVHAVQNRIQTWLDLNVADRGTGSRSRLLRETSKAWVDALDLPEWLPDGTFLWQSERTGFRHVYRVAADGKPLGAVTSGEWDVRALHGAADGWVFFQSAEHSPIENHVYRIRLDGTGLARLTDTDGDHAANFNASRSLFVDVSSTATTPPQTRLRDATGKVVRTIEENRVAALSEYRLGTVEFVKVPARDGFVMEAMMIRPPDFDSKKTYPVMSYTYAGPGAQSARNSWGRALYLWHQYLATRGVIVWVLDNRAASAKGVRSAHGSYRNFGEPELADLLDGVAWLKRQPYVDGSRIGIWGWSFGGFMTAYALTHSDAFKIGIAGAPVTDWRLYDSIYTERYMGLPGDNPEGYDRSSVLRAAADLKGRLLLVHGAVDDNVHTQNSVALIDRLQKAGRQFQFMPYPQSQHGVVHPARVRHMREMMTRFILDTL